MEKKNQKVSFNVAGPHALQMAELQRQCTLAYQRSDFLDWLVKLSSVNEHIYYAIPKEKRASFDKVFQRCESLKRYYIAEGNFKWNYDDVPQKAKEGAQKFRECVRVYSRMISDMLFEQGWMPTKDMIKKVSFDN
jgi:hypothetical protein